MNIIQKLTASHFVATEAQVEALAVAHLEASGAVAQSQGVYLKVLIAGCQAALGAKRGRAPGAAAQLSVIDKVHEKYYAAVMRGITTPDVAPDDSLEQREQTLRSLERNRRSTFARTAKTTLATFAKSGGDIRGIDLDTVTKQRLRDAFPQSNTEPTGPVAQAETRLLRAIQRVCKADPTNGRECIEHAMRELQRILAELDAPPNVRDADHTRTRAGRAVMAGVPA